LDEKGVTSAIEGLQTAGNFGFNILNSDFGAQAVGGIIEGLLKSLSNNMPPDFNALPSEVSNLFSNFTGATTNLLKEIYLEIKGNKKGNENKK